MAKIYLEESDASYHIASGNTVVYGTLGDQTVIIATDVTGVKVDQNVESVRFSGESNSYRFAQAGNLIKVYSSDGVNLLISIPVQGDDDGTQIEFSDTTLSGKIANGGVMTLGLYQLSATISPLTTNTTMTQSLRSQAMQQSETINSIDQHTLLKVTDNIVQALSSQYYWDTASSLTYSYNSTIPTDYLGILTDSSAFGNLTTGWQAVSGSVKQAIASIIDQINQASGLHISFTSGVGDIRFNMLPTTDNVAAFAYFPSDDIGGDVFIDTAIDTASTYLSDGGYGDLTITHELGHALGLKHPFEDGVILPSSQDHRVNTIMSYTDYKKDIPIFTTKQTATGSNVSASYDSIYPNSFMVYDIATLQSRYGVNSATAIGDTHYTITDTPSYQSIWDAGGVDTLDFSATSNPNHIHLTSGSYSDVNYRSVAIQISEQQNKLYQQLGTHYYDTWVADTYNTYLNEIYTGEKALGIDYGVVIENAIGGFGNDLFYDNAVNNLLEGGNGDDYFYVGNGGLDTIYGGNGQDRLEVNLTKSVVQLEKEISGETILLADHFAVILSGVEYIQFSDQLYVC